MQNQLSMAQILLALFVAVAGSSVLAAWITTRGMLRAKTNEHAQSIETEVRSSLRKELDATEAEMKLLRGDNAQLMRKLDRVTDNLVRFARNVCRLSNLVKTLLPNQYRVLAEDVNAEAKRLVKLLGEEFEETDPAAENVESPARSP